MPDIASVSTLLTSATAALDIAKFIKNSDITLEKSEQKLKLAELIEALAEVKVQSADIKQALLDKEQEIIELKRKLLLEQELEYEAPYYWRKSSSTGKQDKDGPFCQQCYDSNKDLIRLQEVNFGYWTCKTCYNNYKDKNYSSKQSNRSSKEPYGWMGN